MYDIAAARRRIDVAFLDQCSRTPTALALIEGQQSVTYTQLRQLALHIARQLEAHAKPKSIVVIHLDRGIEYVSALLGTWLAGCVALPLPRSYPDVRKREIIRHSDPSFGISKTPLGILPMLGPSEPTQQESEFDWPLALCSSEPAVVLCSSGSTGRQKLIVRSHESFFHRFEWTWSTLPFQERELCCQKSHMTTTHSVYELFEPLLQGTATQIIREEAVQDVENFWRTIASQRFTRLLLVPSLIQWATRIPGLDLSALKRVVLMGEYVNSRTALLALETFPLQTEIFSVYGSTEASSSMVCDLRAYRLTGELPLGQPISSDIATAVVKSDGTEAVSGEDGVLLIRGPCLFDGYLNNPSLTEEAFSNFRESRFYNSRDRVRIVADGRIEFVGRVDTTVKIRGFRVDLEEVESKIVDWPGVEHALTFLHRRKEGIEALAAIVCPKLPVEPIRNYLCRELPDYMVPGVIHTVANMPRTASGKLDRSQCQRLVDEISPRDSFSGGVVYDMSTLQTPVAEDRVAALAQFVCSMAASVRGGSRISGSSRVGEAGLDSLMLAELAYALRYKLRVEVPLAIFEVSRSWHDIGTLLLKELDEKPEEFEASEEKPESTSEEIASSVAPDLPLLVFQNGLMRVYERARRSGSESPFGHYNPRCLSYAGKLDPGLVEKALITITNSHEALRLRFSKVNGCWVQRVDSDRTSAIPVKVLKCTSKQELANIVLNLATTNLDPLAGPLIRAIIVRQSTGVDLLLMGIHHLACDLRSAILLEYDFVDAYRQLEQGRVPRLSPPAVSYSDYVLRITEVLKAVPGKDVHPVARAQKSDAHPRWPGPNDLPWDVSQELPKDKIFCLAPLSVENVVLHEDEYAVFKRTLSQRGGVDLVYLYLAALARVIGRLSRKAVRIRTPYSGRDFKDDWDLSSTVGLVVFPVQLDLPTQGDLFQVATEIRQSMTSMRDIWMDPIEARDTVNVFFNFWRLSSTKIMGPFDRLDRVQHLSRQMGRHLLYGSPAHDGRVVNLTVLFVERQMATVLMGMANPASGLMTYSAGKALCHEIREELLKHLS